MIWFTSDWHLGETRMEILQRPFTSAAAMYGALRENHNEVVSPDDTVIVVGDVAVDPDCLKYVESFNGHKTLIRGNHDRRFTDEDLAPYFEKIIPEGEGMVIEGLTPLWITHYPSRSKVDHFNVVGHIHGSWKVQKNMLNVGVDVHHFRPIPLKRLPFFFDAINSYYDDDVWVADHPANIAHQDRGRRGSYLLSEPVA